MRGAVTGGFSYSGRFIAEALLARLLDPHRTVLGVHGLLAEAVAGVAGTARRRLTTLVAEMIRQLGVHRPLDQPLRETLQQAVGAGELFRRARAREQLVDQLVRQLGRLERMVIRAGVDRRQSPIGELIRQIRPSFPAGPPLGNSRAADTTQVRPCLHKESDRPRSTAIKARTQAINALRSLLVTAPPELRDELRALPTAALVSRSARLHPGEQVCPLAANKLALKHLARRYQALEAEITSLDTQLVKLTAAASPRLVELFGVGADTAGAILVAAGDNSDRLRSEAAFSMLCGSSPIPASSGKTVRHRLNRGGNRQANAAFHRIVLVRLRWHQPTKEYVHRRGQEGKTKREIIRCLKRYLAREIYTALTQTDETNLPGRLDIYRSITPQFALLAQQHADR